MLKMAFPSIFSFFVLSSFAAWGVPKLSEGRVLAEQGQLDPLSEGWAAAKTPDEKESWAYLQLLALVRKGDAAQAVSKADEILATKPLLEEEVRSLRAEALEKLGRPADALAENRKLLELSPNFKLKFEANLRTGRIRLAEGKYREARSIFAALEKKARATPAHAEVVIELIRAERRLHSTAAVCKWVRRLYSKDPLYPAVKDWGPVLAVNELDGERTNCYGTNDDFRQRVRALMWAGEEDKARKEVQDLAQAVAHSDRYEADEIRAWFLLQDGEPDEAFQILQDLYPARKNKINFLTLYASAAARSGQGAAAVGAYHRVHELSGGSAGARKALYQSAYLSYQFRDYDGAGRRFKEFIRKYPRSGLRRDSEWNLAWISYLKGDYDGALKQFKPFVSRGPSLVRERTRYWMAMCHWRMGQFDKAKSLLTSLAADRSGSYYTAAARQRLARLPALPAAEPAKIVGPLRWGGMIQPSPDEMNGLSGAEESESEEALTTAVSEEPVDDKEDNEKEDVADSGSSDVLNEVPPLKAPANAKRFERAKALLRMGFADDARWELFEIERRTSGRDELRTLLAIYEDAGQFHRSSAIAQLRFGGVRLAQGYDGARTLWESAYPRAYLADVKVGAKETQLPEEFIWGIMKTESQFKRDAISPVGAMGLMQIMPGTGRKVAALRKDGEFAPARLLESGTAVRYGASYLKHLSKFFDGSVPLIAAGYNAGPHRVHGWLLSFGSLDMDEFIEHIPFLETREYVRRVVANALVYSSLYGGKRDLVDLASPITVKGRVEWSRKEIWD